MILISAPPFNREAFVLLYYIFANSIQYLEAFALIPVLEKGKFHTNGMISDEPMPLAWVLSYTFVGPARPPGQ